MTDKIWTYGPEARGIAEQIVDAVQQKPGCEQLSVEVISVAFQTLFDLGLGKPSAKIIEFHKEEKRTS